MLGVEFEKNKNVTFLIYNEGSFFSKKDLELHSSFKVWNQSYLNISEQLYQNFSMIMNMHGWISTGQRISKGGGQDLKCCCYQENFEKVKVRENRYSSQDFFFII